MERPSPSTPPLIFTIGHSTRPVEDFICLLKAHRVERLIDVRTVPRSRHNPQYNQDTLPSALRAVQIDYTHMPGLGGFRHTHPDSINTGWKNLSFRGFADYMQTPEFRTHLEDLIALAHRETAALMCAEAVPWRCHRSLIADALLVRGIEVREIASLTRAQIHTLTPWARVHGAQIVYPPESQ